ncbi:MAG: response regulator [Rubrivivax sp.]|nr:response regulator [Rubrivivax sp.]
MPPAVEPDTLPRGAARRNWRPSWLGFVGGGLVLALLAVVMVQARQFSLLRQAFDSGSDFGVLTVFQAEAEYLRLAEQWKDAADPAHPLDAQALRHRYGLWVDHIAPLRSERTQRLLGSDAGYRRTLAGIDAFIAEADRTLGPNPQSEPGLASVQALLPALAALEEPIHQVALSAAHGMASQLEQRAEAVRSQNHLGLGLTVFLSVLTLAFAAIAVRQLRQLHERRLVLEDLAASLRQARRQAEAASEAKSAFLANMSHEIRTPFHGLMGMLSLLRETGLNARQIDFLRTATESADHLLALLNDILDMSQLESGRMTLAPVPLDLRALLRDVEALMRPQAMAKSLALHIDASPDVPERVVADPTRVKQVLFNLVSNGIKFSEHGAVVLDVRPRTDAGGAPTLEFIVTDSGIGMDEDTLARLFNRFMQADSSRSRRHGGSGLGLEISRNLARLMGGDVAATSTPGKGSVFTFWLPLMRAADPAPPPDRAAAPARSGRPLQVLVAEDHPVNRQYLAALLDNLGHEAHFTTNGREALDAARSRAFDLVLMDVHMPEMDGVEATRAIRALPDAARSTLPIVALTADAFEETRERCLVAGMNDYLTKPVSPQKLASLLRRLFGAAGTPAAPPDGQASSAGTPAAGHGGSTPLVDEGAIAMSLQAMAGERLAAMIDEFLDQGPDTVRRLRASVRDAQPLELRVTAHALKGAALNLGLAGLAATASALHEGAARLPAHEIARLVQRFEDQIALTRGAIKALRLRERGAPAPRR